MAEAIGKTGTAEDDARRVGALDEKEGALDGNEEALDGNREGRRSTRVQGGRVKGRKRHRSRPQVSEVVGEGQRPRMRAACGIVGSLGAKMRARSRKGTRTWAQDRGKAG